MKYTCCGGSGQHRKFRKCSAVFKGDSDVENVISEWLMHPETNPPFAISEGVESPLRYAGSLEEARLIVDRLFEGFTQSSKEGFMKQLQEEGCLEAQHGELAETLFYDVIAEVYQIQIGILSEDSLVESESPVYLFCH